VVAPRVHHQADPEQVESRDLSPQVLESLQARGHKVTTTQWSAQVQAIRITSANGVRTLDAASDPGKGGEPRGE